MGKLYSHRQEYEVVDAMDNICEAWQYLEEPFPPLEIEQGCVALIQNWEDHLQTMLVKRQSDDVNEFTDLFCHQKTKACKGVNDKDGSTHSTSDLLRMDVQEQ